MARAWEADDKAQFFRRLGKTAAELGDSKSTQDCPDIWEFDSGDIAVIGRDFTDVFASRLPDDVRIGADERLVVIPGNMLSAAKPDIRDA
ncbi:hypothetical protein [Streptomonospora wellingtoniae]|uniref:Uncharacterized protein n=1 Tax=Streptomonospora wellingtoniae TaxID=3075544 RepID=A0ABU2KW62_9ACTN|nr:hypothetical protein [Streptomonospora sp. DSM 45055]MDT0303541.1 hypothetical protein [Streptomonospora sp. DSM 45055]